MLGTLVLFLAASWCARACAADVIESAPASASNDNSLAISLFEEGDWVACRTECLRSLLAHPDSPQILLLKAVAELRTGTVSTGMLASLCFATNIAPEVAAMAGYELGRALLRRGDKRGSLDHLRRVFEITRDTSLYLHAGCTMAAIIDGTPGLEAQHPGLSSQLRTSSRFWTRQIRNECAFPAASSSSLTGRPGQWLIAFYRAEISPALGRRCSLTPSCSEYGRQALGKHGLLGLAFIGDRTVREPQVVADKKHPVYAEGLWHYADPLDAHDAWMESQNGSKDGNQESAPK
jgi:hypothetical protein